MRSRGSVARAGLVALAVVALVPVAPDAGAAGSAWHRVAKGTTGGVSGLAPAATGWVVVHDSKQPGQHRIALLRSGSLDELAWPGSAPRDLEAIAAVPEKAGQYATLTSAGRGTLLTVKGRTVTVDRRFTVPRGTADVESFALARLGGSTTAVWATRGSSKLPASVFAATFAPATGRFGAVSTTKVSVPRPATKAHRQVSDLAVVAGRLVGASTSDPGAEGPFSSALYDLGSVTLTSGRPALHATTPRLLGTFAGHKVEGIACSGRVGLLGSDDEKLGGWTRRAGFCAS